MAVLENIPLKAYTATGASAVFAYDFPVLDAADMAVLVNGAAPTSFVVSGVGNPAGGTVTITPTPSNGQRVVLFRDSEVSRATDYQSNGDLLAAVVNRDFDRLWLVLQEVLFGTKAPSASLRVPIGETQPTLPSASARAGRLVSFDASGNSKVTDFTEVQVASAVAAAYAAGSTADAVAYVQSGAGVTSRSVQAVLREAYISVKDFGATGDGTTDDTTAIQNAINAAYGRTLVVPRGAYRTTAPLTIDPILGGATNLPMRVIGEGFDANGGNGGTFFLVQHAGNCFTLDNSYGINADARFILEGFGIIGDGTNASGGDGVYAKNLSNLIARNLWVQGMRRNGVYYERCYGSAIEDCTLIRNRVWNFYAEKAFNLGHVVRLKAYGGGRAYTSGITGNVCIRGSGDENLGVFLDNVDVSYAGTSAFQLFKRSDSTLTSVVVSGGVATVTTAAAHGRTTGELVSVVGATVAPALNTGYPVSITVTGSTTFTFATAAGDGTYTESTLLIGPGAFGLFVDQTRGATIRAFSEDCIGPALYMGADVDGFEVVGGYWQGGQFGAVIINDSAQKGRYAAMYLTGAQARMLINVPDGPHDVDVDESIVLASGATLTLPTIFKRGGTYYGPAAPTTGTWVAGTYIKRSNPTVGGAKGWYCTVGGTPGTWVSEGNL